MSGRECREVVAQVAGAKAADSPLAPGEGQGDTVVAVEQAVEATAGTFRLFGRLADFVDGAQAGAGVVEGGHEGQVAVVGGGHEPAQVMQAVAVFAQ